LGEASLARFGTTHVGSGHARPVATIPGVSALLASIPSPADNVFELGPVTIRVYGLMLLLGIVAAVVIAGSLWTRQGGSWDLIYRCAMWGVLWGIVGARAYHVITSWDEVPDEWWGVFAVWKGGLGVWGGVAAGVIAGAIVARRAGANVPLLADCVAPGILLAQGIGRFGNYFNQELFGTPTSLPWALEIDPENRPPEYAADPTFHPTFLYEFIWDAAGAAVLSWLVLRRQLKPGGVFWLYVMWYSLARFSWEEQLRVDPSKEVFGMRLNFWIALGVFLVGIAGFVWTQRRQRLAETAAGPVGVRSEG
jgi:prolipoprotein diacylglyceryl transferase